MVKRNKNFAKLQAGYLFPEINKRKEKVEKENPDANVISLGIGNTTEPLTPHIVKGLKLASKGMGTDEGYSGYGPEKGIKELREKIADKFYKNLVSSDEVFVSDGAKPDIGRLQFMFGPNVNVAIQDPAYPVYVDGSVMIGATGNYNDEKELFDGIQYMKCSPENDFFPDLSKLENVDLIYFCSPNNPTGAVASKEQLKKLVDFAKEKKAIILFDAAYSQFIDSEDLPKSIFEIEGSKEVAIEINSFSKPAGFTGVRLGWAVVPKELKFEDGSSVNKDWNRTMGTIFNGASNIIQRGALSALDDKGIKEMKKTIKFYKKNAQMIKKTLEEIGITTHGGKNSPYIWAEFPGKDSWEVFENILEKCHVVTTPGAGFGPAGEGFIRFSGFGHREDVKKACKRLKENLG